jgi:hypothetical protein
MRARWVSHNPSPTPPAVAQSIVAGWWPTTYYLVSTLFIDTASSNDALAKLTRQISKTPVQDSYVTQVLKCDKGGWPTSHNVFFYKREYETLEQAQRGHDETVNLLRRGKLNLKKQTHFPFEL